MDIFQSLQLLNETPYKVIKDELLKKLKIPTSTHFYLEEGPLAKVLKRIFTELHHHPNQLEAGHFLLSLAEVTKANHNPKQILEILKLLHPIVLGKSSSINLLTYQGIQAFRVFSAISSVEGRIYTISMITNVMEDTPHKKFKGLPNDILAMAASVLERYPKGTELRSRITLASVAACANGTQIRTYIGKSVGLSKVALITYQASLKNGVIKRYVALAPRVRALTHVIRTELDSRTQKA